MRAAILHTFGAPLEIDEVPDPRSADDEVIVRVRAVGVCGTDLKIINGVFPDLAVPLIPGHEIAGEIAEGGSDLAEGQRVACYIYDPCGECRFCGDGDDSLCPNSRQLGFDRKGGLAELVSVRRRNVLPFGDELPFDLAAVSMDAVLTPWHALHRRAGLRAGETVVVSGAGGLGLNGIAIASSSGARVAAFDPLPEHREVALSLGAELAVDPADVAAVREWAEDGADLALETSGVRGGFTAALASLRRGGRVVCCGYRPGLEYGFDSGRLVREEITVLGSRAGTRDDARAALDAVERGEIRPLIAGHLPLEHVNEALDRLATGKALGRLIIDL